MPRGVRRAGGLRRLRRWRLPIHSRAGGQSDGQDYERYEFGHCFTLHVEWVSGLTHPEDDPTRAPEDRIRDGLADVSTPGVAIGVFAAIVSTHAVGTRAERPITALARRRTGEVGLIGVRGI